VSPFLLLLLFLFFGWVLYVFLVRDLLFSRMRFFSSSHLRRVVCSNSRSAASSSKSRDKKTNAEANKLRNHISMTEYEITRLTKSLRKRLASIQALEHAVQAHHEKHKGDKELQMDQQEMLELNADVQSLHGQIAILTTRQQGLKDEYLRLTGNFLDVYGLFELSRLQFSSEFR